MKSSFDTLIDTFITDKVGIADDFLSKSLASRLKKHLITLQHDQVLVSAGTGNALRSLKNTAVRGDKIHWLDRKHDNKHVDQFSNNSCRKYSMIIYLNENWIVADGGELRIHHKTGLQDISPNNGKGAFFNSNETEHEVMPTNKARMSITGWLKVT